jgi:glycosyltransferase involved in cell wall biosynthesis
MRAPVGGLFRHVADLTRALAARGHKLALLVDSLAGDSQTEARLTALAPHASLGIFRTPMPRLLGPGDLGATLKLRALIKELGIDVVHGHGAKGGFYARLAGIGGPRKAVLYTPHGGVLHFAPDKLSGRAFHALERALMPCTGALIFESAFAHRAYSEVIGAPRCRFEIIHNGLNAEEFAPVAAAPDAADFVFVGELRTLKGIFVLVEALKNITGRDGRPATLIMAGEGSERGALEARIAELGLDKRVTLVGAQPARAMFARGTVMVVPSLAESLPYVVLEAGAAQRPVIATAVGGIGEIFGPTAADLVPAGNASALAAAMQAAIADPQAAEAAMRARLGHIEAGFSVATMTDRIEALYQTLI